MQDCGLCDYSNPPILFRKRVSHLAGCFPRFSHSAKITSRHHHRPEMRQIYFLQCVYNFSTIGEHICVCRASPAHVSVSLHVPFEFSVADKLKERAPVSAN